MSWFILLLVTSMLLDFRCICLHEGLLVSPKVQLYVKHSKLSNDNIMAAELFFFMNG